MKKDQIKSIYLKKIKQLIKYNKFYFDKSKPIISDRDYDDLKKEIIKLEEEHNFLKSKDSPSFSIGHRPAKNFVKSKHRVRMLSLSNAFDKAEELSKDLAMQVASMGATTLSYKDFETEFVASETEARIAVIEKENIELSRLGKTLKNVPQYISMSQLSDDVMAKAKTDIESQLASEGKPEHIWEKIVPGKIDRFISDNTTLDQEQCLLNQDFIKDENIDVDTYIKSYGDVVVSSFKRVSLG